MRLNSNHNLSLLCLLFSQQILCNRTGLCPENPPFWNQHGWNCIRNAEWMAARTDEPLEYWMQFSNGELERRQTSMQLGWLGSFLNNFDPIEAGRKFGENTRNALSCVPGLTDWFFSSQTQSAMANEAITGLADGFMNNSLEAQQEVWGGVNSFVGYNLPELLLDLVSGPLIFDELNDVNRVNRSVQANANQANLFGLPNRSPIVLDIFGGESSQIRTIPRYSNAINVDLAAREGVVGSAIQLPFATNSVDEIVMNNPYIPYGRNRETLLQLRTNVYSEASRVLAPDGLIIVNGGRGNDFRILPESLDFDLSLVSQGSLDPLFSGITFRRTNDTIIPHELLETWVYYNTP